MKKQLLSLVPVLLVVGSIVSVSASDMSQSMDSNGGTNTTMMATTTVMPSHPVSLERQALQEKARLTRDENKSLRQTSSGARADFRTTNSGALKEMKKGLTDANKADIKKIHDERVAYIQSLSGMTLEQKAQYMLGVEDKIRGEIEARFVNATGSLRANRMDVYEQNAARRAEALANQLELRSARGALRTTEIDAMIAKITAELPNLSIDKKTKLAKKIDEKIVKIQANKRLPDASKTEIVAKLNALKIELMK